MLFEHYLLYFIITVSASTLFAVIGMGSSLVLIPLFTMMGLDFNFAKAIGLFSNGVITVTTSFNNISNELLKIKEILPFLFISIIFATLGAFTTQYIDENFVKILFALFIFFSLLLLYFSNRFNKTTHSIDKNNQIILIFIAIIAFIGGLIGVGGGIVYLPLFLYLGFETKQSIALTSALIPFVSFSAFLSYTTFVEIDFILLFLVTIGSIVGGYFGNVIMHKIKNEKYLRVFITIVLAAVAVGMLSMNFRGN